MSHKYLVSHREASCSLKTRYSGCGGALSLLTTSDGRFQAFASEWYVGETVWKDSPEGPFLRTGKRKSIVYLELGTHVFPYALELETLLLQNGDNMDTYVRNSLWKSEYGNFVWAVRSFIRKERHASAFFYSSIDSAIMESFLTQVHVYRLYHNDRPLGINWSGLSRTCLKTTMENWRRGQAQKYWTEEENPRP